MATGSDAGYRCLATIEVPAQLAASYDAQICKSKEVFTKHDWRMLIPAQRAAIFDTIGEPPGLTRTLLHVWSIPSMDSLAEVMASAEDNGDYVAAQQMTLRETQNLYISLLWADPIGLPDTEINVYMVESLTVVNSISARQNLATYMSNAVYKMNSSYSWKILMAGNATTGIIDQYVHVWGMPDTSKLEQAIKEYRSDKRWTDAVSRVTTSMWTPRPLPCFQEPGKPTTE